MLDLTEEFYLQTIDIVFQQHLLPRGLLEHRGRKVRPELIRDIGVMTVEGENDDISGVGQTQAAHGLTARTCPTPCTNSMCSRRSATTASSTAADSASEIYPRIRDFIARMDALALRSEAQLTQAAAAE